MKKKLKCAVIGVGNMGYNHVRNYAHNQPVTLCGIADIDEETGKKVAHEFHTRYHKSYKDLLQKENPDIVSICVPTSLHYEVAKYCLTHGIHVLLEKPITDDLEKGKKLIALAQKKNLKFFVGHIERFNPAVLKVKEMIEQGELGEIIAITAQRVGGHPLHVKDVDIAIDLAIHDIDIINYLLNEKPKNITTNKQKTLTKKYADSIELFLKYKKASAYIQTNWITPVKIRKLTITGSKGYIEMDYINQRIEFFKSNYENFKKSSLHFSDYIFRFFEPEPIVITIPKKEPLQDELTFFINAVKNNDPIDPRFAIDALEIALQT